MDSRSCPDAAKSRSKKRELYGKTLLLFVDLDPLCPDISPAERLLPEHQHHLDTHNVVTHNVGPDAISFI